MNKLINVSKITALLSFVIGTCILVLYACTDNLLYDIIGLYYVLIAGCVNAILLLTLAVYFFKKGTDKRSLLKTMAYILLNIPVTAFYIWFVLVLTNTMRITFVNTTGNQITQLKVKGCEEKMVGTLAPGESCTKWISIKTDCDIQIRYESKNDTVVEKVEYYVTTGFGKSRTYHIGEDYKSRL